MNTAEQEEFADESETRERPDVFDMFKVVFNTKFIIGALLIYAGLGIPFLLKTQSDITVIFREYGPAIIGGVLALVGVTVAFGEMNKLRRHRREERFIDVDESRNGGDYKFQRKILRELNSIKAKSDSLSPEGIEDIVTKMIEAKAVDQDRIFDSFESYFNEIRRVLLEQAHTSDKKASILLDKGTAYQKEE